MKEKPKYNEWQNLRFMVEAAWKTHKSVLVLCLVIAALKLTIQVLQLYLPPVILAQVENQAALMKLLGTIGAFAASLVLLRGVLSYAEQNTMYARIDVRTAIINRITSKACTTAFPNTRDPKALRMLETAMEACDGNSEPTEHIWHTLTGIFLNCAGFIIYLALLTKVNGVLLLVILATTVAGFFVSRRINEWEHRHREERAEYVKKLNYVEEKSRSVELAKDIRIFGLASWLKEVRSAALALYAAFIDRREGVYIWAHVLDVVLSLARNGVAYAYLICMTLEKGLPASEFLLYFTAVSGFAGWVTGILDEFSTLHQESLGISRVQEYLNLPEPFRFDGGRPIPKGPGYELTMEDVTFRYPGTEKDIIQNLSLTIRPGEKVAVVGLNGAGKTTLVKLLCGFYDPDAGRVLLNGVDIKEFNRREYYSLFSAVFQEFSVLDITVAETVAQRVETIDRKKVEDCLQKAGLWEAVQTFPQGVDTHIGRKVYLDGVLLSGGQTQKLMLARALYKDGPILVLDEPTAALDPLSENDIYLRYHEMTRGKTSLFISHRLASTRFCDRILYFADGGVAEEGTHESLMALGGGYAKLFQVQSRYYQEGGEDYGKGF